MHPPLDQSAANGGSRNIAKNIQQTGQNYDTSRRLEGRIGRHLKAIGTKRGQNLIFHTVWVLFGWAAKR
jgi:aminoglycoside N3'-acetyltransferase